VKFNRSITSIVSVILAWVMGCGLLLLMPEKSWAESNSAPEPSSQIPANPSELVEDAIGNFAWQTFVALNWPTTTNCPNFKDLDSNHLPRAWEFYNSPEDIFLSDGTDPRNSQGVVPPVTPSQCSRPESTSASMKLRLTEIADHPQFVQPQKGDLLDSNDIKTDLPSGFALVDRFGNYVINEARMNPAEVGQIINAENRWYSMHELDSENFNNNVKVNPFQLLCSSQKKHGVYPTTASPKVPCRKDDNIDTSESDDTSMGAIEIKAAWMVLPDPAKPLPDSVKPLPDQSKYYTTHRTFDVTPSDSKSKPQMSVPVALIGFHILQKTSATGWIWSTFEHIYNAPNSPIVNVNCHKSQTPPYYNLYNPCSENDPTYAKTTNKHSAKATQDGSYLWGKDFPYAVTPDKDPQTRSQITRQVTIDHTIASLNRQWQSALQDQKSVLQNYQLIGVQWLEFPTRPYPDKNGDLNQSPLGNLKLINTALEPFPKETEMEASKKKGFENINGSSCIGCHAFARLPIKSKKSDDDPIPFSDFSFLMHRAQ